MSLIKEDSLAGKQADPRLLDILVCPLTKAPLEYDAARQELISRQAKLAFPIRAGEKISAEEVASVNAALARSLTQLRVRRRRSGGP